MPQQERGERRVNELLKAAAEVIAETGYEAATMSAIAERAGACIGSLYQFFPNKLFITQSLRAHYTRAIQEMWEPLALEAKTIPLSRLVDRLVNSMIHFVESNPALLPLLDAPRSTRSPIAIRNLIREQVAQLILAKDPRMNREKAVTIAKVILQMLRALNELYAESNSKQRRVLIQEFKIALHCYLASRMASGRAERTRSSER